MTFNKKEEHPSYGLLGFYRTSGGDPNLFGSSVQHNDKIRLTLKRAIKERNLNKNWYYGKENLFEVEMSYAQFVELVSSMNIGDGVPVTIRSVQGEHQPKIPSENVVESHRGEFEEHLKKVYDTSNKLIQDVQEKFKSGKTLNKKDKEEILSALTQISMNIGCNQSYQISAFEEQMEDTVEEAKGEIEAFYQNKLYQIAQQALVENPKEVLKEIPPITMTSPKLKLTKKERKENDD